MKLDIHAHIMPETWHRLDQQFGYDGFIYIDHYEEGKARMMWDDGRVFREVQENAWSPEAILRDMNAHGVDMMTLCTIPVLFNYWAEAEDTLAWTQFLNDHLASVQRAYPDRFVALGTVPMQSIPLAIQEMTRCVQDLGLPGLEIGSHVGDKNLDDPSFYPFYEAAQELGCCLLVHPWEMMGQNEMRKYWLPWLVGMPAETCRAICSMMFGGIFDKFPDLRVLFVHAGGSFPFTIGRIAHGYECRPDLVNVNHVAHPRSYLGKFWIDSITHDPVALRYTADLLGAEKICYGTDYPFPLGDLEHGKMIDTMTSLSEEEKSWIRHRAAEEFLGINLRSGKQALRPYVHDAVFSSASTDRNSPSLTEGLENNAVAFSTML
jgi:aminocarboxymuconate-semialdehyde decarboxylase